MSASGNRIIDCLSSTLADEIMAAGRIVDLPTHTQLLTAGEMPESVYLLTSGASSTVVTMVEGGSSEVGMIGREGIVGAAALLGSAPVGANAVMQIGGKGLRVSTRTMRALFDRSDELRQLILQFVQSQIIATGQISACNRLHEAEERLARWLLTTSDLAQTDRLDLTQEFLAQMLGSQRTTVAAVAGSLQRKGLIRYSRGKVQVLDRDGLQSAACSCYRVTHDAVTRLYF